TALKPRLCPPLRLRRGGENVRRGPRSARPSRTARSLPQTQLVTLGRSPRVCNGHACAGRSVFFLMSGLTSRTPHPTFRLRESPLSSLRSLHRSDLPFGTFLNPSRGEGNPVDVSAFELPSPLEGEGPGVRGARCFRLRRDQRSIPVNRYSP